jgi:hypothetical protein
MVGASIVKNPKKVEETVRSTALGTFRISHTAILVEFIKRYTKIHYASQILSYKSLVFANRS